MASSNGELGSFNLPAPAVLDGAVAEKTAKRLADIASGQADYIGSLNDADRFLEDLDYQEAAFRDRLEQVQRHAEALSGEVARIKTIKESVRAAVNTLYGYDVFAGEKADIGFDADAEKLAKDREIARIMRAGTEGVGRA